MKNISTIFTNYIDRDFYCGELNCTGINVHAKYVVAISPQAQVNEF